MNGILFPCCFVVLAHLAAAHEDVGEERASHMLDLHALSCSLHTSSLNDGQSLSLGFALEDQGGNADCEALTITISTRGHNDEVSKNDGLSQITSSSLCNVCKSSADHGMHCSLTLQDPPLDAFSLRLQISSEAADLKDLDFSVYERSSSELSFFIYVSDSLQQKDQSVLCEHRDRGSNGAPSPSRAPYPLSARIQADMLSEVSKDELVDLCKSLTGAPSSRVVVKSNVSCQIIYLASDECKRWKRFQVLDRFRLREPNGAWHIRDFDLLPPLPATLLATNGVLTWKHYAQTKFDVEELIRPSTWARLADVMLIELSEMPLCINLGFKCVPIPMSANAVEMLEYAQVVYVPCNILDLVPDLVLPNLQKPVIFLSHVFPSDSLASCSPVEPHEMLYALDSRNIFRWYGQGPHIDHWNFFSLPEGLPDGTRQVFQSLSVPTDKPFFIFAPHTHTLCREYGGSKTLFVRTAVQDRTIVCSLQDDLESMSRSSLCLLPENSPPHILWVSLLLNCYPVVPPDPVYIEYATFLPIIVQDHEHVDDLNLSSLARTFDEKSELRLLRPCAERD
eukprot:761909-Hanusia_phi.AAC.2